jgi:crotonobetainyl-CoA:carnitine CoA-transferase CaiB-like acyl-CoA transferase
MQFSRTPTSMRLPQPRLGEHSESVLKSLGFAADAVADLSS